MSPIPAGFSLFRDDLERIAALPSDLWGALRGARLLVTGGTGFFGIWMLESLLWADREHGLDLDLLVLSRDPKAFLEGRGRHFARHSSVSFIKGDIAGFDAPSGPISHILHFASEGGREARSPEWPGRYLAGAIDGTRGLLDLAARRETRAILLASSGAVYNPPDPGSSGPLREGPGGIDDYLTPQRLYAQSKRMMETLLAEGARRHGYRALVARCFAFCGPYLPLDQDLAFGNFLADVLAGRKVEVKGDGTAIRSYLYAADLVVWLLTILAKGTSGRPYNVGAVEPVSIGDLARRIAAAAGGKVVIRGIPVPGQAPHRYLPDVGRAQSELGLAASISLDEGIARSLAWYRGQADLRAEL